MQMSRVVQEAKDALTLLGEQIRAARIGRGWTQANLAERIGSQQKTISAIENGQPGVRIGTVFQAALMAGVPLFETSTTNAALLTLPHPALLRRRARPTQPDVDDDF